MPIRVTSWRARQRKMGEVNSYSRKIGRKKGKKTKRTKESNEKESRCRKKGGGGGGCEGK